MSTAEHDERMQGLKVLAAYAHPRPGTRVWVEPPPNAPEWWNPMLGEQDPALPVQVELREEKGWRWPSNQVEVTVEGPALLRAGGRTGEKVTITSPGTVEVLWQGVAGEVWVSARPAGFTAGPAGETRISALGRVPAEGEHKRPPLQRAQPRQKPAPAHLINGACGVTPPARGSGGRIALTAEPGALKPSKGYRATITARIEDNDGNPWPQAGPVTLVAPEPAQLEDVSAQGATAAATLRINPADIEPRQRLLVRAEAPGGQQSVMWVPVGEVVVEGSLYVRPGDGTDQPVAGERVVVEAPGDTVGGVYEGESNTDGTYAVAIEKDEPVHISAGGQSHLPNRLKDPVAGANAEDTIQAPPLYLVSRDSLELARRRTGEVYNKHQALTLAGSLPGLVGITGPQGVNDPTAPSGAILAWLDRVEDDRAAPRHTEEALRRLNLALEVALLGGRDLKSYADEVASAIYEDGAGAVVDLYNAVTGLISVVKAQRGLIPGTPTDQVLEKTLSTNLIPQRELLDDHLVRILHQAFRKMLALSGSNSRYLPTDEWMQSQAEELAKYIAEKVTERSRKIMADTWRPDGPGQEAALDALVARPGLTIDREVKAVISAVLASAYLDMVRSELASAAARAAQGAPQGFAADGYAEAHRQTRANVQILEATRQLVGETPGDAAWKAFIDGTVKDYNGWGKMAIAAVTGGRALPVLKWVDLGVNFGSAIFKGGRFLKGMELMHETLAPGSIWWQAVERGIRTAVDDRRPASGAPGGAGGAGAAPGAGGAGAGGAGGAGAAPSLAPGGAVLFQLDRAAMQQNGQEQAIDAAPFVHEGRTMVPLRAAAEALGAEVGWDGAERRITLRAGGRTVELWLDKTDAAVDGVPRAIDPNNPAVGPVLRNNRTFVPLRFLAEALGAEVKWDPETRSITLETSP